MITTLGELSPGDLFETLQPTMYGSRGVVTDGGAGDESEVVFCDERRGVRRWLPNSTPARLIPWPAVEGKP